MGTDCSEPEKGEEEVEIPRLLRNFSDLGTKQGWDVKLSNRLYQSCSIDGQEKLAPLSLDGTQTLPANLLPMDGTYVKAEQTCTPKEETESDLVKSENEESSGLASLINCAIKVQNEELGRDEDGAAKMHKLACDVLAAGSKIAKQEAREHEGENPLKRRNEDAMDTSSDEDSEMPPRKKHHQSRGAHVKERPEMHATARSGQRHWGSLVQILRHEWEEKQVGHAFPCFQEQIRMCTRSHIKSQHECLLRMLQIAALDGIIIPLHFSENEKESFLGWTGFQINAVKSQEFQQRIVNMFESSTKQNTINNAFRRAGLVPDQCWGRAWRGLATFTYKMDKRAVYNRSTSGLGKE